MNENNEQPNEQFATSLSPDEADSLRELARTQNRSESEQVRVAVQEMLTRLRVEAEAMAEKERRRGFNRAQTRTVHGFAAVKLLQQMDPGYEPPVLDLSPRPTRKPKKQA